MNSRTLPPRPTPLPVSENGIPHELKVLRQWVCWQYEYRPSQTKPWTKVPKNPATVKNASNTTQKDWGTFKQALACYKSQKFDGIGMVLTADDPYVAIDLDGCCDPETGEIAPWAQAVIDVFASYTEISPSGSGIRIFLRGHLPPSGRKKGAIEVYETARYMTLTGAHLTDTPCTIELRQAELEGWHHEVFGEPHSNPISSPQASLNSHGASTPLTDNQVLEKASTAVNGEKFAQLWSGNAGGYPSTSEADSALCCILAFWTRDAAQIDRIFRTSGLMRDKWEEKHGGKTYGRMTIERALSVVTEHYAGNGYGRGASVPMAAPLDDIHLTDVGNGLRLVQQFGQDLRYVTAWDKWLAWDECRWQVDAGRSVEWHAKQVIARMYRSAEEQLHNFATDPSNNALSQKERKEAISTIQDILKWAHTSENSNHIETMVKRARANPSVQVKHTDLDANGMLFQVINGTIDLKTGQCRPPNRDDLITRLSPVAYDADAICPEWLGFLRRIQGYPQPNETLADDVRDKRIVDADRMITYLKRLVGMSLTADITAQILMFLHGAGQNGKSTFLNAILALMGEYGMQAAHNFLLVRDREQHPTELADLFGKRFISTIEIEKGKHLAESLMKTLTGSENVRARRMREDFWQFAPTWKIWLAANDKPKVKGRDKATWRRIKLIPFDVTIPDDEVDRDLPDKLLKELPGILNWAIEGCLEWQEHGLQEPKKVTEATEAYREETDILAQFCRECCMLLGSARTQSSTLLKAFETYTGLMVSPVEFAEIMKASGFKKKTVDGKVYWLGIGFTIDTANSDGKSRGAN